MMKNTTISFEFFPAKTPDGESKQLDIAKTLAQYNTDFFSVTYGAGGSTRKGTLDTVARLQSETGVVTAPHLSCVGASKAELAELIEIYKQSGVSRIVALSGDLPSGMGAYEGDFRFANELVSFIRELTGDHFEIEVGAYPEMHPQAKNYEADLRHFANKVKAGANTAITQYFYNTDAYFRFVERTRQLGVEIPIVAGIMPITNRDRLLRFSQSCGSEVPRWIVKQLDAYQDDIESIKAFGLDVVTAMCEKLKAGGCPGFHLYTLNQLEPSLAIAQSLGLAKK